MRRLAVVLFLLCGLLVYCAPSGSRVSFRSVDGFALGGRIFGSGTRGVILSHMYPSDQSSWFDEAGRLSRQGYQVLTFDFRGYPGSGGTRDIGLIDRDVAGAIRFMMQRRKVHTVVLVGASMGGTASLIAASNEKVAGVAVLSAPLEFRGLDAGPFVAKVSAPKLFIASVDDPSGAGDSARQMFKAAFDPDSDLKLLPGREHGTDILRGASGEEAVRVLEDFIRRASS